LWKLSHIESKHTQVDLKSLVSLSPHSVRIQMRCRIWPMGAQYIRSSFGSSHNWFCGVVVRSVGCVRSLAHLRYLPAQNMSQHPVSPSCYLQHLKGSLALQRWSWSWLCLWSCLWLWLTTTINYICNGRGDYRYIGWAWVWYNRLRFKTSGTPRIVLEESMEYISN